MIIKSHLVLFVFSLAIFTSCTQNPTELLKKSLGDQEYSRLMNLPQGEFYQSSYGFREYAQNYDVVKLLIPEFITVNKLIAYESKNLHSALAEIHALENNYDEAIASFRRSLISDTRKWQVHYINGTIAFLEKDRAALDQAIEALKTERKPGQLSILQRYASNMDMSYKEVTNLK